MCRKKKKKDPIPCLISHLTKVGQQKKGQLGTKLIRPWLFIFLCHDFNRKCWLGKGIQKRFLHYLKREWFAYEASKQKLQTFILTFQCYIWFLIFKSPVLALLTYLPFVGEEYVSISAKWLSDWFFSPPKKRLMEDSKKWPSGKGLPIIGTVTNWNGVLSIEWSGTDEVGNIGFAEIESTRFNSNQKKVGFSVAGGNRGWHHISYP